MLTCYVVLRSDCGSGLEANSYWLRTPGKPSTSGKDKCSSHKVLTMSFLCVYRGRWKN